MGSPFWQQFQFENLEGICPKCGSLHLSGRCSAPSPPSVPEDVHKSDLFGPWMAATRQRRSSLDLPAERKKKLPQSEPAAAAAASHPASGSCSDGWQVPGRVARRSLRKTGKTLASVSVVPDQLISESVEASEKQVVPVAEKMKSQRAGFTEHPRAELQPLSSDSKLSMIQKTDSMNPFALLGKDLLVDGFGASRDANPGPSKRARPVESQVQRIVTKTEKRKGKGVASSTSPLKDKVVLSDSTTHNSPSLTDLTICNQVSVPEGLLPQSTSLESRSHESVVSCLKMAIQGQCNDSLASAVFPRASQAVAVTDAHVDDNQLMDCTSQKEEGGTLSSGYLSDNAMLEDQVGAPPPQLIK